MPAAQTRFREVRSADEIAAVLPLLEEAVEAIYAEEGGGPQSARAARRHLISSLEDPFTVVLVAEPGISPAEGEREPIGIAASGRFTHPLLGSAFALLHLLYVRPAHRRRGIGGALLGHLEESLRRRGIRSLGAWTALQDDAIVSMGERRGYVRQREWISKDL